MDVIHKDLLRDTKDHLDALYPGLGGFFEQRVDSQGRSDSRKYPSQAPPSNEYRTPISLLLTWDSTPEPYVWRRVSMAWYRRFRTDFPIPCEVFQLFLRECVREAGLEHSVEQFLPADSTTEAEAYLL